MDAPTYSSKQVAEMLGVSAKVLAEALKKDVYTPDDIWELRAKLDKFPARLGRPAAASSSSTSRAAPARPPSPPPTRGGWRSWATPCC